MALEWVAVVWPFSIVGEDGLSSQITVHWPGGQIPELWMGLIRPVGCPEHNGLLGKTKLKSLFSLVVYIFPHRRTSFFVIGQNPANEPIWVGF